MKFSRNKKKLKPINYYVVLQSFSPWVFSQKRLCECPPQPFDSHPSLKGSEWWVTEEPMLSVHGMWQKTEQTTCRTTTQMELKSILQSKRGQKRCGCTITPSSCFSRKWKVSYRDEMQTGSFLWDARETSGELIATLKGGASTSLLCQSSAESLSSVDRWCWWKLKTQ